MSKKPTIAGVCFVIVSALVFDWRVAPAYGQQSAHFVCGMAAQHDDIKDLGEVNPADQNDPRLALAFELDCAALRDLLLVNTRVLVLREKAGPNAFAQPGPQHDGFVYLGRKLIDSEFKAGRAWAISAILGHEFCHIIQEREQCPWRDKRRELLADYWAGWFVARREEAFKKDPRLRGLSHLQGDPAASWKSVMEKGDYEFTSPDHHGTPEERAAAFKAGFDFHRSGQMPREAYLKGVQYIEGLSR